MTCPAVLRVVAGAGLFSRTFLVGCVRPDGQDGQAHKGHNHTPDLSSLPLSFGGSSGVWSVKIKV